MESEELLLLAERVEALSGPDIEIFYKVRDALWPYDPATPREDQLPALLARQQFDRFIHTGAWLDAATTLVPEDMRDEIEITTIYRVARVTINMNHGPDGSPFYGSNECNSIPLALCAAALRALAGGE